MTRGQWCVRALRGLRPDRNPLRRTSDRAQTYLLAGLFIVAAAGAPFVAQTASHAAYAAGLRAEKAQLGASYRVRAVLTEVAVSTVNVTGITTDVPVPARWTSVAGVQRGGLVMARTGSPRGSAVTIWTDADGDQTSPPLQPAEVTGQAQLATGGTFAGIGLLYLCAAVIIRRVLYRRRMAAWDAEWAITAPVWNRQRW